MIGNKKERKVDSKLVHQSRVFNVYEDNILLPNGKPSKRGWVSHGASVAIVPVNHKGELLLIKQYRYPTGKFMLEIPAGNMDKGRESPLKCAQRELAEETGFKAKKMIKIFEGYSLPGYCTEYMYFFLALDLYPEKEQHDDDEFIELKPVKLKTALKMLTNKKIIDTKTAVGVSLAAQLLNKQNKPRKKF